MHWDRRGVLNCCLCVLRRFHQLCLIARAQLHSEQLAYCQILRKLKCHYVLWWLPNYPMKSFVFIIHADHKSWYFLFLLVLFQEMVFHWLAAVVLVFESVGFLIRTFGIMNGFYSYCTASAVNVTLRFIATVSRNLFTLSNDMYNFKNQQFYSNVSLLN